MYGIARYTCFKPRCIILNLDDETRVVLEEIPGVLGSDYINASWINVRVVNSNFYVHTFPLIV